MQLLCELIMPWKKSLMSRLFMTSFPPIGTQAVLCQFGKRPYLIATLHFVSDLFPMPVKFPLKNVLLWGKHITICNFIVCHCLNLPFPTFVHFTCFSCISLTISFIIFDLQLRMFRAAQMDGVEWTKVSFVFYPGARPIPSVN